MSIEILIYLSNNIDSPVTGYIIILLLKGRKFMADKLDLKKDYKKFYNPSSRVPEIVDVPKFKFLMIDGMGLRNAGYHAAIQALFGVSYKIKFTYKKEKGIDYAVMPLEGLWWADNMDDFITGNKDNWKWTLMIMQPDFVNKDMIDNAIIEQKKKNSMSELDMLRFETFKEGKSAQIMHIGAFSEEHSNIMKIHKLIEENGGKFDGKKQKHHEIYLSDFRKTSPEKLKTVLRQPFI